jgi:predicted permease
MGRLWRRLTFPWRRDRFDQDLDEELRFHFEAKLEESLEHGLSTEAARRLAARRLGNRTAVREASREVWAFRVLEQLAQDVGYGLRMLGRSPGFTAVAVATLALGIGANTAVFSVVDAVVIHPLPYYRPEEILLVTQRMPLQAEAEVGVSPLEYFDYRERNRVFAQVAAYERDGFNLTGEGTPLRVVAARVSASAFPLLGVTAALGRTFLDEEDRTGAPNVAIISHSLWQRRYGGRRDVLATTIKLDEQPYRIVGVMPASFRFPFDGAAERADLWVPEAFPAGRLKYRTNEFGLGLIGRLKPGVSREQARLDLEGIAAGFMGQHPESYPGTLRVVPRARPLAEATTSGARPLALLLAAAVACVLGIACANVANLLLARAGKRSREMAIRSALGAGRTRLLRQCLVESLLLALLGGAGGVLLGRLLLAGLRHFGPASVPRLEEVTLHGLALLFTAALSLGTSLLFGFAPAWRLSHVSPHGCLKDSAQLGPARGALRVQHAVAVVEIALALALLVGGGLLLRSFALALNAPLGFRPAGVLVVRTLFDRVRYPDARAREAAQRELLARLARLPGVDAVAAASHLPLTDDRRIGVRLEGAPPGQFHSAENSLVSPGYFRAQGVALVRGRDFTEQDRRDAPNVAIVSEGMARRFFPGQDPIGRRFQWGDRPLFRIVGVAADVRTEAPDVAAPPMVYVPMFQIESAASGRTAFVMRRDPAAGAAPEGILHAVQEAVWSVDRDLPVYSTTSMSALVSAAHGKRRFTTLLITAFAVVALVLAAIGLFGVVSCLVTERERELAVRLALGAERGSIHAMVLRGGAVLGVTGAAAGLALYAAGSSLLRASLYEIGPYDPATLASVAAFLLGVVLLAAYLPARRATRMDPIATLRRD